MTTSEVLTGRIIDAKCHVWGVGPNGTNTYDGPVYRWAGRSYVIYNNKPVPVEYEDEMESPSYGTYTAKSVKEEVSRGQTV